MTRILQHGLLLILLSSAQLAFSQGTFQELLLGAGNPGGYNSQPSLNGGVVFTCWTQDQFGTSGTDILLTALNAQGDTIWTRAFGGASDDRSYMLLATADEGYLVVGSSESFGSGNGVETTFLIRTDAEGDTLWARTYDPAVSSTGALATECNDGGFLLVGSYGGIGWYMRRIDAQGNLMWTKGYDRHDPPFFDSQIGARCVNETSDGNFFVGGTQGGWGFFLSKIDPDGNVLWTKTAYGNDDVSIRQIETTPDHGIFMLGQTSPNLQQDYLLIKLDSLGTVAWAKAYGGADGDWPYSAIQTVDGGFAMTGVTQRSDSTSSDVYFLKTDSLGEVLFSRTFGDSQWDAGRDIVEADDGGFFVIAWTQSFGFNSSMYLIKTDSTGAADCHQDSVTTIVTDVDLVWNDFELESFATNTTEYSGACNIKSGATLLPLCSTGVDEAMDTETVRIFPNPAHDRFTIAIASEDLRSEIEIYNAQGERVYKARTERQETVIDRSSFANGIYFIKVTKGRSSFTEKIVLE